MDDADYIKTLEAGYNKLLREKKQQEDDFICLLASLLNLLPNKQAEIDDMCFLSENPIIEKIKNPKNMTTIYRLVQERA